MTKRKKARRNHCHKCGSRMSEIQQRFFGEVCWNCTPSDNKDEGMAMLAYGLKD